MAKFWPIPEMYENWEEWAVKMVENLEAREVAEAIIPPSIPFSNLPPPSQEGTVLWCPDHADGAGLLYSTGSTWARIGTLEDDSVGTLAIEDGAVTADKLAETYVTEVRGSASVFTKIAGAGSVWETSRSAATFIYPASGPQVGHANPPPAFQEWPMERFLHFTSVPITIQVATLSWDNDIATNGEPTLEDVTCTIHHSTNGGTGVHMTESSGTHNWPKNTAGVNVPMITPNNNWTVADYSEVKGNIALDTGDPPTTKIPANSFIFAQVKTGGYTLGGGSGARGSDNIYGTFSIEWTVD